jgi:two-component system sensor histidine kinase YesM
MMQSDKQSSSLGLKNVYQRLKLYYGDEADLRIESELDEYTKVIMKMPLSTEGEL